MQCLPPGNSYRHLPRRIRSKYTALLGETHAEVSSARFHPQVHHRDRQPANSNPDNLVTLCTGCHLYYHQQHTGNISPGQLSLSLEIESQNLTLSVFQPQLSLAITIEDDESCDLRRNNFALISNVNINVQLSLLID